MKVILRLIILLCPLFLLLSCNKYKSSDPAFFIRTDKAFLSTNHLTQGAGSHGITDLWLYVNGQFQGVYPLGNLLPIVTQNNHATINVFAGIKNNGISKTRLNWQMYQRLDIDTTVEAGKTIDRNFTFTYNPSDVFGFIEDFDGQGVKVIKSAISEVPYSTISQNDNFEGTRSLKLELPTIHDSIAQIETADSYTVPLYTANLYTEFDYKCNSAFEVGLICDDGTLRPIITMNPISTWNHVYISLADEANYSPVSSGYKIYFRMLRTGGASGVLDMFLDNVKLVYIP